MKKFILYLIIVSASLFFSSLGFAQDPTYELRVLNSNYLAANILEFEIYLKHTNPNDANFEYAYGQYMFKFNTAFANGGTLTYTVSTGASVSDLPIAQRPNCTKILNNELRLTTTTIGGGEGATISDAGNGTKIIRMKLQTTTGSFAGSPNLTWKNSGGYFTKVFAYVGITCSKNITVPAGHIPIINPVTSLLNIEALLPGQGNCNEDVTIELRDAVNPNNIIRTQVVPLSWINHVAAVNTSGIPTNTEVYIVFKHRNSLETWSSETITIEPIVIYYSFINPNASQAYCSNERLYSGVPGIYRGDFNQDGLIDVDDYNQLENDVFSFATGVNLITDLNCDQIADITDILILEASASQYYPIIVSNPLNINPHAYVNRPVDPSSPVYSGYCDVTP